MFVTFLITFREGLEAFLLVGILLSYLDRLGAGRQARWIYLGVAAGLVASVVAAFVLQVLVGQLSSHAIRTVLTAAIMLLATAILTYMAIWMGKQAKAHTDEAKRRLEAHVSAGRVLGIVALAFLSVLREGIETVLFLSALSYSGEGISAWGSLAGLALSIVVVWLLLRGTRQVPIAAFFRWTSLLLIVIAAGLLGSAMNQLQVVGVAPGGTAPVFDISGWLPDSTGPGVFLRGLFGYNATPTGLQLASWAAYLAIAVTFWGRARARGA
ncbi:FTR1 family iron permease [Acidimangrovimonas sediminis]|uniref:FTR1 family iron permease n=1 Tax=Acidimangrovimonas sediminis TaxID=2056283 RepID=UPI000C807AD9|nr:FTR1 family protein [Acidimangrovimonas sediminis]